MSKMGNILLDIEERLVNSAIDYDAWLKSTELLLSGSRMQLTPCIQKNTARIKPAILDAQ